MKKLVAFLFAHIASLSLFAGQGSTLSVASVLPVALEVQVDGFSYNANDNIVTIQNLASGSHSVAVYSSDKYEKKLVFNQNVRLKEATHFDITINRFGTAMMDERFLDPQGYWYGDSISMAAMSDQDFRQARSTINAEWFDKSREIVAKQIIDMNYFTTEQVQEILKCFTYDESKLAVAKYAYSKTVDKNKYYLLNKHFTYSWTKDELASYVRDYR